MRGIPSDPIKRAALFAKRRGRVHTAETKAKMSAKLKGKPKSAETRANMKAAQKILDRAKENFLMSRGWRVIRIGNDEVQTNLEGVVAFILAVAARPAAVRKVRPF